MSKKSIEMPQKSLIFMVKGICTDEVHAPTFIVKNLATGGSSQLKGRKEKKK